MFGSSTILILNLAHVFMCDIGKYVNRTKFAYHISHIHTTSYTYKMRSGREYVSIFDLSQIKESMSHEYDSNFSNTLHYLETKTYYIHCIVYYTRGVNNSTC